MARSNVVTVRVSDDERAALEAAARREGGVTLGEALRTMARDDGLRRGGPPAYAAARRGASPRTRGDDVAVRLSDLELSRARERACEGGMDLATYFRALLASSLRAAG